MQKFSSVEFCIVVEKRNHCFAHLCNNSLYCCLQAGCKKLKMKKTFHTNEWELTHVHVHANSRSLFITHSHTHTHRKYKVLLFFWENSSYTYNSK